MGGSSVLQSHYFELKIHAWSSGSVVSEYVAKQWLKTAFGFAGFLEQARNKQVLDKCILTIWLNQCQHLAAIVSPLLRTHNCDIKQPFRLHTVYWLSMVQCPWADKCKNLSHKKALKNHAGQQNFPPFSKMAAILVNGRYFCTNMCFTTAIRVKSNQMILNPIFFFMRNPNLEPECLNTT